MKFIIQNLKLGDRIEGVVSEILSDSEVIMSFYGDLLRVQNQIGRDLSLGQSLLCRVIAVAPLKFELVRSEKIMDRLA